MILSFGKRLREEYYKNLPGFIDGIELLDSQEFSEMHSDFLSRLAMTFSHGDYAKVDAIKEKEEIAQRLYEKSLEYYPNHRAYLGLGIIKQRDRSDQESIRILSEAVEKFPESEPLNICLAISYMNLEEYEMALSHLLKFGHSKEAAHYIASCHKALGGHE